MICVTITNTGQDGAGHLLVDRLVRTAPDGLVFENADIHDPHELAPGETREYVVDVDTQLAVVEVTL